MSDTLTVALERYRRAVLELQEAEAALRTLTAKLMPPPASPGVRAIQEVVAEYFRLPVAALWAKERHEPLATARVLAMALCHNLLDETSGAISGAFRRCDSLVRHTVIAASDRYWTEATYRGLFDDLRRRCLAAPAVAGLNRKAS